MSVSQTLLPFPVFRPPGAVRGVGGRLLYTPLCHVSHGLCCYVLSKRKGLMEAECTEERNTTAGLLMLAAM